MSHQRKTTMSKQRDEYTARMKHQLDELNHDIDTLQAKAHDAKVEAREKYQAELTKLRHQSKLAVAKLEEMKTAGEGSWDKMVAEMDKLRDAFTHSFHYFKTQV